MKTLTIAFLYNVRHIYPDSSNDQSQLEADNDDPETIEAMVKHLKNCGFKVIQIEADENAYIKLQKNKKRIDLAFNYSMGIHGRDRYAHIPSMLEMLQIPYTGPSPLTEALILNKAKNKIFLSSHGVPVLPQQIFTNENESLNRKLKFPLIVKPSARGSSAGITNSSVVFDEENLRKQVSYVIKLFKEPALVEPFITGREFSVAMLGNPPTILPIIEADHSVIPKGYHPLDSLEVKWILEEQNSGFKHLMCPAKIENKLKKKLEDICYKTWNALDMQDWCRIDIRCDNKGKPYVLDVNSPPGMIPPEVSMTSYFPLAARSAGIEYDQLIKTAINAALKRYGKLN